VLWQVASNGAVLEMSGDAAKIEFGGALTLIHNTTEDQLTCSGKIQASDVLIEGTSTTVAEMMAEHAAMKDDIAALKQFVGMMPPPSMPPAAPPPAQPFSHPHGYFIRVQAAAWAQLPYGCTATSCLSQGQRSCFVVETGETEPSKWNHGGSDSDWCGYVSYDALRESGNAKWTIETLPSLEAQYSLAYGSALVYSNVSLVRLDDRQQYYAVVDHLQRCLIFGNNGLDGPGFYNWGAGTDCLCGLCSDHGFNLVNGGPNLQGLFEIITF